ncbi:response regulator transcription factor [Thalassomonas haliotis]|uniref:Response regulator transcription factor n=1 Tax=Thalassomonas haliotis TaxID=485448 RepID=A0ABY7VLW3_9GAMM|nr:response regulator transcription factor [Thalassomonas haliotis]WDE14263.1 response regulator transcription factor [Thalassomonas haliotis]
MQNSILLIDNDRELTAELSHYLASEGFALTVCNDGISGLMEANRGQYQLILSDLVLPKLNGFEFLKQLRSTNQTPVMMLTERDDQFDRIYALELGADDYLCKPFNHRELVARIKSIVRRMLYFKPMEAQNTVKSNGLVLSTTTREAYCHGAELNLTGFEFEMLSLLMAHAGTVVDKDKIADQVLRRPLSSFDRSIDMHISKIRKKIALITDQEKIKTVRGAGYIFLTGSVARHLN